MDDTQAFFNALYPNGLPPDSWLLLWTLPDKVSYWQPSIEQALQSVIDDCKAADTYFGLGLSPNPNTLHNNAKNKGTRRIRVTNAEVIGIPGVWLDLDYSDETHKKTNLPSQPDALNFLKELPEPTVIVHSGHGYQAYWLFDAIWQISGPQERAEAQSLVQGFIYYCRALARGKGWDIDSVIDLARVFRVPGTTNYKNRADPVPVRLISDAGPRYPRTGLPTLAGQEAGATGLPVRSTGTLVLDPNAQPPFDAWESLCAAEPRARLSFDRKRTDLQDQSASSYDLSLATFAVLAGWTEQEITNLLISARRKHGDDTKTDRDDYYPRTIARAKTGNQFRHKLASVDEASDLTTDESAQVIQNVVGIPVQSLVKYMTDPPVYTLELLHEGQPRSVTLGGIEHILSQQSFRNKIASAINRVIPRQKDAEWDKTAQTLLNMLTEQELPESTPVTMAKAWIQEYLQEHRASESDWEESALQGRPFVKDGGTYVILRGLVQWLRMARNERITNREIARYLHQAGAVSVPVWIQGTAARAATTRNAFRVDQMGGSSSNSEMAYIGPK